MTSPKPNKQVNNNNSKPGKYDTPQHKVLHAYDSDDGTPQIRVADVDSSRNGRHNPESGDKNNSQEKPASDSSRPSRHSYSVIHGGSRTPILDSKNHARLQNCDEQAEGGLQVPQTLLAQMMDKTCGTRTFSKRTQQKHLAELNDNDGVSMKSHNDTIVSLLAFHAIKKIKASPGISRDQIISEIDQRFPPH